MSATTRYGKDATAMKAYVRALSAGGSKDRSKASLDTIEVTFDGIAGDARD